MILDIVTLEIVCYLQKILSSVLYSWADQCGGPHDHNRRTDEFPYVGQNYAWTSKHKTIQESVAVSHMVDMWYAEVIE